MIFIHTFSINKIRRRLRKNNGAAIWKATITKNRTTYAHLTLKKKTKRRLKEKRDFFSCLVIKYEKAPTNNNYLRVMFF